MIFYKLCYCICLAGVAEPACRPAGWYNKVFICSTYVYAISSQTRKYVYVGITNDISRRLKEHNSGHNKTTKPYTPFCVLYSETCKNRMFVRTREKYLKSGVGKEFLKNK